MKVKFALFIACILMCSCAGKASSSSKEAPDYTVSIMQDGEWKEAWVQKALVSDYSKHDSIWNDWDNSKGLRDTMSLALFEDDFAQPVKVRVHTTESFKECKVRPTCYDIEVEKIDNHTVEFVLPSFDMRKVSVEFDGNRQENLFVIGNRPDAEKPSADAPGVLYYGPGVHEVGEMELFDNQTVYVDFGAVLYANFIVSGDNIRVAGNGIISGSKVRHWGNDSWSCSDVLFEIGKPEGFIRNLVIEDVTILDSANWTLCVNKVSGLRVENINIVNWILNGDGIDLVCCEYVQIKDCLIRCYDDCISMKVNHGNYPDCKYIEIDGCLIWEDIARGIVVGPEAGNAYLNPGRIHSVDIHDCIFLEHRGTSEGDNVRAALSVCQWRHPVGSEGYSPEISDITCRNLYFDSIQSDGTYIFVWQTPGQTESCYIRNLTFDNIVINNENDVVNPVFQAITNDNHILGMTVKDFTISGEKVLSTGEDFVCTGNFTDLTFN